MKKQSVEDAENLPWLWRWLGGSTQPRRSDDPLETVLWRWTKHDPFKVRDLLNGGIVDLGRSGSGKTSSSGKFAASRIVEFPLSGGLILAAKGTDLSMWQRVFEKANRSEDLLVFGPDSPLRLNFLDYARQLDGQTRNIVHCLRTIGEGLQRQEGRGGDRDNFWQSQEDRMLYNAIEVVRLATGQVTAADLQQLITNAALSPDQLSSPEWRAGAHSKILERAHQAPKTPIEAADFQLAIDFWLGEIPSMADRTRSSILAGVLGTLHVFNTGQVRALVSGATNVSPDDMFRGKWVFVNMPPAEWSQAGSLVCAGWKYLTQRAVLRRTPERDDFINVIWADEAHQFVNSFDAQYVAQCRSHRGCMVYLSQSLPGFYASFAGESAEHQTHALLGNFAHTIVHAVDPVTAEWAAKKLGRHRENFYSGSLAPSADIYDQLFGENRFTASFSEHYENILQENVFQNGLRTGGLANGLLCDAIVIRSGEPFSNGENFLFQTFSQE